ncbi:MAG: caspase, EACC1-associated type [Anaerolineales bacterium]
MSKKYALIIGNTEYTDPGLAQLTAPGKDAADFGQVLDSPQIAAFDDVTTLINEQASKVSEAIDYFFSVKKPDDLLVLYFSGHGVRDEYGSLYLAVKNTNRARLRSTAIKSDFIREAMDQSRSRRQILILDCCNSGAFAQGTKAELGGSVGTATAFEGTGYGRVVLTASDSTQFAWEGDKVIGETDNSLFTHFLVKGLEGDADRDGDGKITIDELYDYAYEQIVTVTPKQTPGKWSYKQQGEIILRQNIRIEDTRPVPLPEDLVSAINNSLPYVREGAVSQLELLLKGKNLSLSRSARLALEKIAAGDDSRQVAKAAAKALESIPQSGQKEPQKAIGEQPEASTGTGQLPHEEMEQTKPLQQQAELEKRLTQEKPAPQPISAPSRWKPIGLWGGAILAIIVAGFALRSLTAGLPGSAATETSTATPEPTEEISATVEVLVVVLATPTEASTPTEVPSAALTSTEGATSTATPYPTEYTDSKGVLTVLVPAGDFQMGYRKGDPDERQVHTVDLAAYYIDKFEVTNALYRACEKAGVCKPPINTGSATHNNYYGISGYVEYPVIYVDWNMAKAYCEWRGARLPTEAEWEKAARGNLDEPPLYPWGNGLSCQTANYNDGHGGCVHDTQKVGAYESGKSPYGVYDMAGNVWEWVADRYSEAYYGTPFPSNPQGPDSGQSRVLRGGAWNSGESDLRASNRRKYAPIYANFDTGFRCASPLP